MAAHPRSGCSVTIDSATWPSIWNRMACLDTGPSESRVRDLVTLALFATCVLLIVAANAFVLHCLRKHWRRGVPAEARAPALLLANLSVADALVGLTEVPYVLPTFWCAAAGPLTQDPGLCVLRFTPVLLAHYASGFTMIAICVDRYIAVEHCIRRRELIYSRRIYLMIAIAWLMAAVFSHVLFFWNGWERGSPCTPAKVIPFLYNTVMGLGCQFTITVTMISVGVKLHLTVSRMQRRRQPDLTMADLILSKSARAVWLYVAIYMVSWTPLNVVLCMEYAGHTVSVTVMDTVTALTNINYIANPFLYAANMGHVRLSVRGILDSCLRIFGRVGSVTAVHSPPTTSTFYCDSSQDRPTEGETFI